MDSELDHVIYTVLSLEEEYSALSLPPRNQENAIHTSPHPISDVKTHNDLPNSDLQQALLELYTLLGNQDEAHTSKLRDSREPTVMLPSSKGARERLPTSHPPLKGKLCEEDNKVCKKAGVENENSKTTTSANRCRKRTMYNKEQTNFLLNQFHCDPYPDFERRCQISRITGISEPRIQVWFQNRRARHLLQTSKSQHPQRRKSSSTEGVRKIYNENPQMCNSVEELSPQKTCGWF
ncbi:homeobox protein siamois-like [Pseudophryne corroboree]|uniref:homeobox protein siamois-like n=1 Tax=Pseudophryne corroboree TaxID=495146 RepID=UPI0030819DBC